MRLFAFQAIRIVHKLVVFSCVGLTAVLFFLVLARTAEAGCWPISGSYRCSAEGLWGQCRPGSVNIYALTFTNNDTSSGCGAGWDRCCTDYQCSDIQSLNAECGVCPGGSCTYVACGGGFGSPGCIAGALRQCRTGGCESGRCYQNQCQGGDRGSCEWWAIPNEGGVGDCSGEYCAGNERCATTPTDYSCEGNGCYLYTVNNCCNRSDPTSGVYVPGNGTCSNGSCQYNSCGVQTTSCSNCSANTTSVTVTPGGTVGDGQTSQTVRPTNSANQTANLSVSPNPGNWSVAGAASGSSNAMNVLGWALGTYTVTATHPAGAYCVSSGNTSFTCVSSVPDLVPQQPSGAISVINLSSYSWTVNTWGMDSCGGNVVGAHDGLPADTVQVKLYEGECGVPGYSRGALVAENLSCPTTSPCTLNATLKGNWGYNWDLIYSNGVSSQTKCTNFSNDFNASPWWQVVGGSVYSQGDLKSSLPASGLCSGSACPFDADSTDSVAGAVVYGGGSADFNGGTVSASGWLSNSRADAAIGLPTYDAFYRQVPVTTTKWSSNTLTNADIQGCTVAAGSDACYIEYTGNQLSIGQSSTPIAVGTKKVVVYAPNAGQQVRVSGDITYTSGQGFFGLITRGQITIASSSTARNVAGFFFAEGGFHDSTGSFPADGQLTLKGIVSARSFTLYRNLDIGNQAGGNNTTPAEKFVFAPDLLFTIPRALKRVRYQLNELPPTDFNQGASSLVATVWWSWPGGPPCQVGQPCGRIYANRAVSVYKQEDNSLVDTGQTDSQGVLYMSLPPGDYLFRPSTQTGYPTYTPTGFTIVEGQVTDISVFLYFRLGR